MTIRDPTPLAGLARRLESPYHRRRRRRRAASTGRQVQRAIDAGAPVVVFAVSTDRQLQSASSLAAALAPKSSVFYLDRSGCLVNDAASVDYLAALPRLLRNLDDSRAMLLHLVDHRLPIAMVVAHDYGLREQALVSLANQERVALSVLLPDGLLTRPDPEGWRASRRRRIGYRLAHRALGTEGRPGELLSSRPNTMLGWGPAWIGEFEANATTAVCVGGSPRFRPSAHPLPDTSRPRLLVCNPTESRLQGGDRLWRRFVDGLRDTRSEVSVRVRHRPDDPAFNGVPYADDLGWATHVAAVRSTVLIEAASTGRGVVALESSYWSGWMGAYVGLTDARLARFDLDREDFRPDAVVAAADRTDPSYGPSYIADRSPRAIGEILLEALSDAAAGDRR